MSRLALLIGANPETIRETPIVRLGCGDWAICIEGTDIVHLDAGGLLHEVTHGMSLRMTCIGDVQVHFPVGRKTRGNVSVYLEKMAA